MLLRISSQFRTPSPLLPTTKADCLGVGLASPLSTQVTVSFDRRPRESTKVKWLGWNLIGRNPGKHLTLAVEFPYEKNAYQHLRMLGVKCVVVPLRSAVQSGPCHLRTSWP